MNKFNVIVGQIPKEITCEITGPDKVIRDCRIRMLKENKITFAKKKNSRYSITIDYVTGKLVISDKKP